MTANKIRCEGYRRYGGAFTLGPVRWVQCKNTAVVMLTVIQEEEAQFPACNICWKECIDKGIQIAKVTPLEAPDDCTQD